MGAGKRAQRRPGMGDVAALAGVSHQTVSRVLNNSAQVRPETRARVKAAMEELDYRPNLAARTLKTRRSALLGILVTGLQLWGPATILSVLETRARAAGYGALVCVAETEEDIADARDRFFAHSVDGVVVVAPRPWILEAADDLATRVPTVAIADTPTDGPAIRVSVDQRLGAVLAVDHLIAEGFTDIAHICGQGDQFDATQRTDGWRQALTAAGLAVRPVIEGDWSSERGHEVGQQLLRAGELPQAIFCGNDATALGLVAALRQAGRSVPADMAVVGFDDAPGAAWFDPPLTTVAQPLQDIGRHSMTALVTAMTGQSPPRVRIPPTLVVRASSHLT